MVMPRGVAWPAIPLGTPLATWKETQAGRLAWPASRSVVRLLWFVKIPVIPLLVYLWGSILCMFSSCQYTATTGTVPIPYRRPAVAGILACRLYVCSRETQVKCDMTCWNGSRMSYLSLLFCMLEKALPEWIWRAEGGANWQGSRVNSQT